MEFTKRAKRKTLINKILIEGLQRFFFVSFFFLRIFLYGIRNVQFEDFQFDRRRGRL